MVGDHLSMGTKFLGTICPWGPNWLGTVCPEGPMNWGPIVGDQISRDHMDLGPNVSQYLSNIFWLKPKYLALLTFLSLETKMSKEGLDFVYTIYLQAFSTTTYTTWCPLTVTSRSVLLPLHYKFCMDCTRTACTRWIHVYVCYVLDYVVVALHVVCI